MANKSAEDELLIGVDVGTGSVRAALVTIHGNILQTTSKPITVNNPQPEFYQQSSDEIWSAVCCCVGELLCQYTSTIGISGRHAAICGIGFAATCSLVVVGPNKCGLR